MSDDRNVIMTRLRDLMRRSGPMDFDWDTVQANSPIAALGFDSLTIMDLIYDIQQEFGVEFEAVDLAGLETAGALADFLLERQPAS